MTPQLLYDAWVHQLLWTENKKKNNRGPNRIAATEFSVKGRSQSGSAFFLVCHGGGGVVLHGSGTKASLFLINL